MMHIWRVEAPLGDVNGDAATATLSASMDRLIHLHPHLRSASVQASEGVLVLELRVTGRDRWAVAAHARKIGSRMLERVRIDVATAKMVFVARLPNGRDVSGVRSFKASAE